MKKIEYQVVRAEHEGVLAGMVEANNRAGWRLQGGVAIAFTGQSTIWAQAMIRDKDDPMGAEVG